MDPNKLLLFMNSSSLYRFRTTDPPRVGPKTMLLSQPLNHDGNSLGDLATLDVTTTGGVLLLASMLGVASARRRT
jgi:hypothetical protein